MKSLPTIPLEEVKCKAGRVVLNNATQVMFVNKLYRPLRCLEVETVFSKEDGMSVDMHGNLDGILAIKIGILSMLSGTVPSIAALSIWGKPANKCNRKLGNELIQKWLKRERPVQPAVENTQNQSSMSEKMMEPLPNEAMNNESSIPKQYIDPIVCSVMKNPVLLPSGHTVDQRTLDKHILTQAEWGRPPSDPFTGILFSESYKPVTHIALKLKLDLYFLDRNSENVKATEERVKRKHPTLDANENPSKLIKHETHSGTIVVNKTSNKNPPQTGPATSNSMENSLELALGQAKSRSSKFRTLRTNTPANDTIHCAMCKSFLSTAIIKYSLPCTHRLCRVCMDALNLNERKKPSSSNSAINSNCPICMTSFNHHDVIRVYS